MWSIKECCGLTRIVVGWCRVKLCGIQWTDVDFMDLCGIMWSDMDDSGVHRYTLEGYYVERYELLWGFMDHCSLE